MTAQSRYDLARGVAVALMILSAMIATAAGTPDTGLTRQMIAWLTVAQAGITIAVGVLPRVQGDGRARRG